MRRYHAIYESFDENVEDVAPPTVKIVWFDNDALVSDQGFHIKLIVNTWSKQLCSLMGPSNVDLKSYYCICTWCHLLLFNLKFQATNN